MKKIKGLSALLCICLTFILPPNIEDGTEYWALLFAVGVYYNHPDKNRPSMLEAVEDLYEALISSPQWDATHIHKVKGSQCTGERLVQELMWLIRNEDEDDITLVYMTTHGSPLKDAYGHPLDLPPKDEEDGVDEILIMYHGFDRWYSFIWDDLLNFFLSLLDSKGVCLIVDSCFSGGFNDFPFSLKEFQRRVVLMSCEEHTLSYGSEFTKYLIKGFSGKGDSWGNKDGINSAEESFYYAQYWVDKIGRQHPTILDLYPGELPITQSKI